MYCIDTAKVMIIEICATTLKSISNAQDAGANRIELCENYSVGGITPKIKFLQESIKLSKLPINVLIRPRAGNFLFSVKELENIFKSINKFKDYNVKGFVVGFVNSQYKLDAKVLNELRSITDGYELTFHRAFDFLTDQDKALDLLIDNKFDRILCSGSKVDSEKGLKHLKYLNSIAKNNITIMPGGGINPRNFNLFKEAGFKEIHLSGINKKVSLDSDYNRIKEIIEMSKQ